MRAHVRFPFVILVAATTLWAAPAHSRGRHGAPSFPGPAFRANESTARWLGDYDRIAWKSSDLVLKEPAEVVARLAPEWFCFQDASNAWHAVYGRLDAEGAAYVVELHYVERDGVGLARTDAGVDPQLAARYGRAVRAAFAQVPDAVARRGLRLNSYVRPIGEDRLETWLLPAGQPDGTLAFGAQLTCVFDAGGNLVSKDDRLAAIGTARPDPTATLEIDDSGSDVPSVGSIFFLLTFRSEFRQVLITTRCYVASLIDFEGKNAAWIHALRDVPGCADGSKHRVRVGRKRKDGG